MVDVIILGMIVGIGYWIVSPLLRPVHPEDFIDSGVDDALQQLEARKEVAISTIKELEFDLNMGKISQEDYEDLTAQYTRDAVDYIKEIEDLKKNPEKKLNEDLESELELEVLSLRKKPGSFCTQCGDPVSPDDNFCGNCGEKMADTLQE